MNNKNNRLTPRRTIACSNPPSLSKRLRLLLPYPHSFSASKLTGLQQAGSELGAAALI